MMRSLFSAVSGLKTHQTKMDVIGNNVANVNTVAFKSSTVTFSEIMYQTVSGASGANAATGKGGVNAKQIGLGVTSGATKVTIASSGAAETTGDGMDLRLTDKVSTNFFIVNDGTQNLFTRAGSFYVDGAGNLAMTSTGYTVMGWQVDETTGDIRKDTVSALRVMQEKNLTSAPEATTAGTVGGVMDKNDSNVTSDDGYIMTMSFFDKQGYTYTAKFAVKVTDPDTNSYTVELTDILDSNNHSVLNDYTRGDLDRLATVFGKNTTASKAFAPTDSHVKYLNDGDVDANYGYNGPGYYYAYSDYNATGEAITMYVKLDTLTFPNADDTYTIPSYTYYLTPEDAIADAQNPGSGNTFTTDAKTDNKVTELFGINLTQLGTYGSDEVPRLTVDEATGNLLYTEPAVNYNLKFSQADGTFSYVDMQGSGSVVMHLAETLGDNFEDIEIDFSTCKAADNGGKSTMGAEPGFENGTVGKGKALGVMIGLSINSDGKIYGSYDNGNTVLLGQIAVAQFANASGLEKVGENCYTTTLNSGDFDGVGIEIAADGSSMTSGELEMSNVDLSTEFTQMIITQRGFQSNSRVITVSDTLLEELINLKR